MKLNKEEQERMFSACISAKEHSYSPYSKFRVGCALLLSNDDIISGCNVENVSYGITVCAERTAYVKAVSEGYRNFKAVAVNTDVEGKFVLPCGPCRQFMMEFGDVDVYTVSNEREFEVFKLSELLPGDFCKDDLNNGVRNGPKVSY